MTKLPWGVTVILLITISVAAQTPTPTPSGEELKLQQEKILIELQRDIELAKKAIRDAQPQPSAPPAPTASPLAGDAVLGEGMRLEAEMVAYRAMSLAAKLIAEDIWKRNPRLNAKHIAIYDRQIVEDWRFFQALFPAFEGQIKDIKQQYQDFLCADPDVEQSFKNRHCRSASIPRSAGAGSSARTLVLPDAVPAAFAAGSTFVKSFIDLAALFRTDTKIEGSAVTIDESALVAEVFRELLNNHKDIDLYYPEVFPPRVNQQDDRSETIIIIGELFVFKMKADEMVKKKRDQKKPIVKELEEKKTEKEKLETKLSLLKRFKTRLDNLQAALKQETHQPTKKRLRTEIEKTKVELSKTVVPAELDKTITNLENDIKKLESEIDRLKHQVGALDDLVSSLENVNEGFGKFVAEFLKVDANGVNALALFIKSEDIKNAMPDNDSYWLEIKSVSTGGNNRVRKNLLWYFAGARVDHSGGVIVEYTLYDNTGKVVSSDKLAVYEGYLEPKKIKNKDTFKDPVP